MVSESGGKERRPKPIAGSGEVMADGGGVQSGIDSTKENSQTWLDHVRNDLVSSRE